MKHNKNVIIYLDRVFLSTRLSNKLPSVIVDLLKADQKVRRAGATVAQLVINTEVVRRWILGSPVASTNGEAVNTSDHLLDNAFSIGSDIVGDPEEPYPQQLLPVTGLSIPKDIEEVYRELSSAGALAGARIVSGIKREMLKIHKGYPDISTIILLTFSPAMQHVAEMIVPLMRRDMVYFLSTGMSNYSLDSARFYDINDARGRSMRTHHVQFIEHSQLVEKTNIIKYRSYIEPLEVQRTSDVYGNSFHQGMSNRNINIHVSLEDINFNTRTTESQIIKKLSTVLRHSVYFKSFVDECVKNIKD